MSPITNTIPNEPESFREDEALIAEQDLYIPDTFKGIRENLLLVSGLALVFLATGMALINLFS